MSRRDYLVLLILLTSVVGLPALCVLIYCGPDAIDRCVFTRFRGFPDLSLSIPLSIGSLILLAPIALLWVVYFRSGPKTSGENPEQQPRSN